MRAFASTDDPPASDVAKARVRYPRPSRLGEPLEVSPRVAAEAAEALGLRTVGDLLEHLPRDTGESRTIAALVPGETATVLVEVRSITSRPVRRRGMKPLVEATVADETGVTKATFFNQPWLERKYRPGTRLMLAGSYQGRNRFRVNAHAVTSEVAAVEGAVAQYPATKGIDSTRILSLVREHRDALADVVEPLPARLRASEDLADRPGALTAMHFPDDAAEVGGARRRLA